MKKVFNLRILGVLVLLSLVSCEKSFEPVAIPDENALSVSEAKEWFEDASKNARTAGDEIYSQVYWKYAFETKTDKQKKQSVVIVPISHGKRGRAYGNKQLWIYKNTEKKNTMRVVEFVYDKDIPRQDLGKYSFKNFTGAMVVRNWDDDVLGAFRFKEGKAATILKLESITVNGKKEDIKPKKNARTADCSSGWSASGWYVTVNGIELYRYTEWEHTWNCTWFSMFDMANDNYGSDGGWDDGGYWSGGGGGGGDYGSGPGDSYFKKASIHDSPCEGLKQALAAQAEDQRETMGLVTTDGKLILTPNESNNRHGYNFTFGVRYYDSEGRIIIVVDEINGVWNAGLYFYDSGGSNPRFESHDLKGIVHTHPIESGYNEEIPSPEDYTNAANFPMLSHYIVHDNALLKYNTGGESNRLNNWKNNCGGTKSLLN